MSKRACGLCDKDPAEGFASVNGVFYCHGDDDPEPTCYMRASASMIEPDRWTNIVVRHDGTGDPPRTEAWIQPIEP